MTDAELIQTILKSNSSELFPDASQARIVFRHYAHRVHPDVCSDPQASEAFVKLQRLYDEAKTGKRSSSSSAITVVYENNVTQLVNIEGRLFRFSKAVQDNDVVRQALTHLQKLATTKESPFYPEVKDKAKSQGNQEGYEIVYPDGAWQLKDFGALGDRDIIWIYKRLLVALHGAHSQGFVHGDINANTVLILPKEHGLVLDAWESSVKIGRPLVFAPQLTIPAKFLKKEPVTEWIDIAAASQLMLEKAKALHPRLNVFFTALTKYSETDALSLLQEFTELADDIYERRFSPLAAPTTTKFAH